MNLEVSWAAVESLESSLESDPRYSDYEKQLVRRLKEQVSELIGAKRDGREPYAGSANVTVSALESSIRKRTTGADGWPLA
jgi:hypothetical protein